jgi:hypothetical protein
MPPDSLVLPESSFLINKGADLFKKEITPIQSGEDSLNALGRLLQETMNIIPDFVPLIALHGDSGNQSPVPAYYSAMKKSAAAVCVLLVLSALACDHTNPADPTASEGNGRPDESFSTNFPRQLTFNRGGDTDPYISGDTLLYSRRPIPHADSDWCLAFLPLGGGILSDTVCPDDGAINGVKEAYLQPSISPDGLRIAYVEQTGDTASRFLSPITRRVMVGPASAPMSATVLLDVSVGLFAQDARTRRISANSVHRLQWLDNSHLVFIASSERTLSGVFCCDTLYVPMALIEANVDDGSWRRVEIGPLPPFDMFVTDQGAIRFTQDVDWTLWRQSETCQQFGTICPEDKIFELAGDSLSVVADFSGVGPITRMFGRGAMTLVLSGGSLFSVDGANGRISPSTAVLPPQQVVENVAINSDGTRAVAMMRPSVGPPPDFWLLQLDN